MEDPALPMRSAAIQSQKFIVNPFRLLPTPRSSPILIIDGLYECEREESQDAFVALISQVLNDPAVTIQFIVSGLPGQQYERVRGMGVLDHLQNKICAAQDLPKHAFLF